MIAIFRGLLACSLPLVATLACAEDTPEFPGPAPEHELLKRFVGEWEVTGECATGPDSEPTKNAGTMISQMLGDRWVINKMKFDTDGVVVIGVQTLGYDPTKQKYVGAWTDNMMNHLWVYEGAYDEATRTLTLDTEGPNMMGGGELVPYQDSYEFVSDDRVVMRSKAKGEDGEWTVFMTSEMRRVRK